MTDADLRAFVTEARAQVEAKLVEIDALDLTTLPAKIRAEMEEVRRQCSELLATLTDEAVDAEVGAAMHAGRPLMPSEAKALARKQ